MPKVLGYDNMENQVGYELISGQDGQKAPEHDSFA